MLEIFLEKIIKELGTTGLLIIGLYWILYKPLRTLLEEGVETNKKIERICNLLGDSQKKKW